MTFSTTNQFKATVFTTFCCDKYRFGFNGKENDNEIKGEGNSLDFGGRIYNNGLGKWLSLDPLEEINLTKWHFCKNNV
jgi:RHS repeat-associated protein